MRAQEVQSGALAAMREVVAAAPVAMVVVDPGGRIELASPAAERLFGYGGDELIGRPLAALVPELPVSGAVPTAAMRRARRKDGTALAVSVTLTPCAARGPGAAIAVVTDEGEPARLRVELEHARWLSSVGELTLGLAHELSGPLASVTLNVEVARTSLVRHREAWSAQAWAAELVPALDDALLGVEEARRTVAALREVARPAADAVTAEVARAVELALVMTRHRLRARGRVELALTDTPPLAIEPTGLARALVLAVDAAAGALDPARIADNVIRITAGVAAGAAWIELADTGGARSDGAGSALAAARALVAAAGGTLVLDGARVRLTVPVAPEPDQLR